MSEIGIEHPQKVSKNPLVQDKVDQKLTKLQTKYPDASLDHLTEHARDKVAHDLVRERLRGRLGKAVEASLTDPLTGLPNRRWFEKQLEVKKAQIERLKKTKGIDSPLYVLYIDFDNFKKINTQYGNEEGGDEALKLVSKLPARKEEPVARWGGDEFIQLVNEEIEEENFNQIVQRYLETMREEGAKLFANRKTKIPVDESERVKDITISIGIARYEGETPKELIKKGNAAMQEAKKQGKNKILIATKGESGKLIYQEVQRENNV